MANFDPRRIYDENELQSFVPVTLYQGDEELGTVQMPREAVEGKSEKEVINAAFRAFQKLKAAEEGLDRERIREMAKDSDLPDALCLAAAVIGINICLIKCVLKYFLSWEEIYAKIVIKKWLSRGHAL